MSLVVLPLPFVDVSVGMNESSLSAGDVLVPVPFVDGAISPDLLSPAMPLAVLPLAFVDTPVIKLIGSEERQVFYIFIIILVLEIAFLCENLRKNSEMEGVPIGFSR